MYMFNCYYLISHNIFPDSHHDFVTYYVFNIYYLFNICNSKIYPPVQIIGSFTLRMYDDDVRPTAINTMTLIL